MIIRKPIKLKAYRLSCLYSDESYNKLKNNLLFHNLTSNYELQKNLKLKNSHDNNLTETKEFKQKILLSKVKLGDIKKNNTDSKKSFIKPKIKMNNLIISNSIKDFPLTKNSYKATTNNTSIINNNNIKSNKNIFKKKYLYKKNILNNKHILLPKIKGSKEKKYSLKLFEREQKKQRDKFNQKLRDKLLELEECEKQFDLEIMKTLSKLNDEGKKLDII